MDEYLTKKQLEVYLHISHGTVQALMKQIPYVKLGKRVLFRRQDVDAFMEGKLVRKPLRKSRSRAKQAPRML